MLVLVLHWASGVPDVLIELLLLLLLVLRTVVERPVNTLAAVRTGLCTRRPLLIVMPARIDVVPWNVPPPPSCAALARMFVMRNTRWKPAVTGARIGIPLKIT